jgi:hypothetical protein
MCASVVHVYDPLVLPCAVFMKLIKPLALCVIMFFSLQYLGFGTNASLMVSLIPLVLGFLNVLALPAYTLTGVVFIIAALSSLLPAGDRDVLKYLRTTISNVSGSWGESEPVTTKPIQPKNATPSESTPARNSQTRP